MQKIQTAVGDVSSHSHVTELSEHPKIRLFYAGDMDFARPQFASDAPQLELLAVSNAVIRDARARDSAPPVDIAFIDCSSPGVNAAALVDELRRAFPGLPIVIAVDPGRDDAAREAIQLRADDYTVKSPRWLARLPVRLGIVMKRHRRVVEADALRSEEERLRWIIESAPVCLTRVNREGTVLAINTAARAMIGANDGKAVLRKSLLPFVDADNQDTLREFVERVCGGHAGSTEFTIPGEADASRFIEAHAIPLPPRADKAETALLVLRDISTRRRLEKSLEHVEVVVPGADRTAAVAELEGRLAEIDEQRRQLTDERDQLARAVEDGNATVDALGLQLEQRGIELSKVAAERDELSRRVATTDASLGILQSQLGQQHPELSRLTAERDHLLKTIHDIKPAVAGLKQELERRRLECDRLSSDRDALQGTLQALQSAHASELEAARADCGRAESRLREAESAASENHGQLQQRHGELDAQLREWKGQCDRLEAGRDALQGTLREAQQAHASELEAARADCGRAEGRLRDAEAAAHETRAQQQRQHDELEAQLHEWKGKCLRVETDRDALQGTLREAQQAQQAHASELEAARADCGRAEGRLRDAEAAAHETRAQQQRQHDELEAQLHEWKGKCLRVETDRDALQGTLADIQLAHASELETARADCGRAEARLRDAEAVAIEKRSLEQQHAALEAQLQEWKGQCLRVETDRDTLQGTLREAQQAHASELEAARADCGRAEGRLRDAEAAAHETRAQQQRQHDELEAQLHEWKGKCLRVETDRDALQGTLREAQQAHASELEAARADCGRAEGRLRDAEAAAHETRAQQQRQHDELEAQLHEWKGKCERLEGEREDMKVSLTELRAQAVADRDAYELMELHLQDSDSERLAASAERDRLKRILAEAFAQYQNVTDGASSRKETR